MRILISGGPGSGCTSTAAALGAALGLPVLDSDTFFHKPTDPPFQAQSTPEERRDRLQAALSQEKDWILSGSISTWGLADFNATHGIFLAVPQEERMRRLAQRQRTQFGSRIDPGGDMAEEHRSFMQWATDYESRAGAGRNLTTDLAFVKASCEGFMIMDEMVLLQEVVGKVMAFVRQTHGAEQAADQSAK